MDQPIGQIYATITLGARSMAGYKAQVPVEDRWAIAAYVKALQLSETEAEQELNPDSDNASMGGE